MDRVTLQNFRCFRERQTARLAPLTLLVGENSTGKTSFMAMARALWDVAYRSHIPNFKEQPYDLGSFDEIAHYRGGKAGRADTFEAGFETCSDDANDSRGEGYGFKVIFAKKETAPIPIITRIYSEDRKVWIEHDVRRIEESDCVRFSTPRGIWEWKEKESVVRWWENREFLLMPLRIIVADMTDQIERHEKNGGQLTKISGADKPDRDDWILIRELCYLQSDYVYREGNVYASAPVRSKPHRTYDPSRPTWDPEGDYIPMYLANLRAEDNTKWGEVKKSLERFGLKSGLFDEINIKSFGTKGSDPFQVQVRKFGNRSKGPRRNLIDVGYGVSQVLPVITELLHGDVSPMFLLQQPEVHLHPSAQAALGSLFCDVASSGRHLMIETHSDYILDRVRLDIRDGETELKPEDVSILFFERKNLDVRIHSVRIDGMGNVLGAPPSYRQFFMNETNRLLGL